MEIKHHKGHHQVIIHLAQDLEQVLLIQDLHIHQWDLCQEVAEAEEDK